MTHKRRIGVIPGDGIGPEIMDATLKVLSASGFEAEWIFLEAGLSAIQNHKEAIPFETIETIRELGIAIKGPTTTPSGSGHKSANVALRQNLDLFANIRPVHSIPGISGPFEHKKIDIVVVRENTEDLYAGIEYQPHHDVAQAIKVITRQGCRRLIQYAFDYARKKDKQRVTAVHKANIMKLTDGMFVEEFYRVSKDFPEMHIDDIIVDNCCMQLVTKPEQFDVLVAENLYGDIISDLCAGLIGGLGLAPSANIGEYHSIFESVHGSAPDIAGKGIANPTALLMSSVLMLEHLGETSIAGKILSSIMKVYKEKKCLTMDVGGTATTEEYTDHLIETIQLCP